MRGAESFDAQKLARYTVIRVRYAYSGQPAEEKLFIVLKHVKQDGHLYCWCLKTTSQTDHYAGKEDLLEACVTYESGKLPFFRKPTIIDPNNPIPMYHATLETAARKGEYKIEGKMPSDFHKKIADAIRKHPVIEPKNKKILLESIGEKL
ncbi:MAG: hypothetical protein ACYCOR_13170 [Acidobacteriaceae bacterium]